VYFPDVNYELSLEMEMLKRESWRRSTSFSKKVHTCIGDPFSMITKYDKLKQLLADFNLGKRISTACEL
jgi:Txe/YoeB family toxin of Txe-Axe toxin-antitoxin module